ncbi:thiamine pyrophosphate-dependent dehydrogenase E1 component subunit alpha [Streptomyces tsukubensis]|uniref:thiamine pyrophosphate-dependent dehydrogenase E1 component subunit alpha n=1 Tax=Streptomyces tsukubensis TaxID=83656 RepID=UPI000D1C5F48|nr:thiamine pyrophosphate-dependent dehydrogenase E1 component subunit alpha [Streptomyces tsukubensis]QFR94508.1 pyruvate dehydrogenase (acetyl-transferring) E1 component subunit alpha [Streptomyces tsukubensis]
MTVMDERGAYRPAPPPAWRPATDPGPLLPDDEPYRVLGTPAQEEAEEKLLLRLYAELVRGRRFNTQATALTRQGRLAVYPSSTGQEACEVAAALVLREQDWLFPTYRDTLALVARGVDPVEALTLLRGDRHTGYDSRAHRVAPLCTPLATHLPHAVGLAHAARLKGDDVVALALVGDGGTSEGDFHEALNFAAVWRAPVVFLVQNNGFAISVPLAKQTAAPSLAHKAVGYGIPGRLVDGNDAVAVHEVLSQAVRRASEGGGPTVVEAVTYRLDAHTNADDATRYRKDEEIEAWRGHDPVALMERALTARGLLDEAGVEAERDRAERFAAGLRERMNTDPELRPLDLFGHVYADRTTQLMEQAAMLGAELEAETEPSAGSETGPSAGSETGPSAGSERGPSAGVQTEPAVGAGPTGRGGSGGQDSSVRTVSGASGRGGGETR